MGDEDNQRKSKQEKKKQEYNDIKKIEENTQKEVEELYKIHSDEIINKHKLEDLKKGTPEYEKAKNSISKKLEVLKKKCIELLINTITERINEYKRQQKSTVFEFSKKAEPIYEDDIRERWITRDEMDKTQKDINDLGIKLIKDGKTLSPKFFGEMENYPSDDESSASASSSSLPSASASSSSLPSASTSSSSLPSASASPSASSTPGLKSILKKRKLDGGRKTKKHKKSRAKKSRVRKSKARK